MKPPLELVPFLINRIRVKLIASWLLFLLFCFLLRYSWHHRILWLALLLLLEGLIQFTKPRLMRAPRPLRLFVRCGFIIFLASVLLHAFHPGSAAFLMLAKVVSVLFVAPILCYKAYADYGTFRTAPNRTA
jgi:hypothetical protein